MNLKKLIYCVHAHPALWDQKDEGYNNKVLLKQIWEEIADDMSSSAELCRQKWRSLRDVFRRELKKYQSRLMDPKIPDKNLPRWYYFKELHFLTDQMLQTSTISEPLPENSEEVFESFYVKDEPALDEEFIIENSSDKLFTYDNNREQVNPIEVDENQSESRTEANLRFIKDNVRESLKRNLNYQFSFAEERKRAKFNDKNKEDCYDSDYHFLMSLLPFMQAIPQNRKMIIRTKIQNIICEETTEDTDDK